MTKTDTQVTPLSKLCAKESLREFIGQLLYADRIESRKFERFAADHLLLDALDEELRQLRVRAWREEWRDELPRVADLDEQRVRTAVRKIEGDRFGKWELTGDERRPILERLDEHFAEQQAAHAEHVRERDRQRDRQARASAELGATLGAQAAEHNRRLWGLPE